MIASLPLLLLLAGAPDQAPAPAASRTVTCSFSNPGYSGWCRVVERVLPNKTPKAVCQDVLKCLSDVWCIKTYCSDTPIRTNWKLERVRSK